ncbi:response regulator transcription factor [Streptomyces antibioticus]|nr:LuxR C-terminal-related transcriptional regulator [Streptomyces antibioticus]QIT48772.1 response regulator transcription factor [Streptomyces antibioticus]
MLVSQGLTNRQISQQLRLSEWTVVNHVRQVMRRLDVPSRIHVAQWVLNRQRRNGVGTAVE